MLKIFVTGDNHIGLRYASHANGQFLSAARKDAFADMVHTANEEDCDLFVITGDLFNDVSSAAKKDITELAETLSTFRGVVVVLPGNHDHYDRDAKLWRYFTDALSDKDNIMLLSEYRPYEIKIRDETAVLYPALCTSLHSILGG